MKQVATFDAPIPRRVGVAEAKSKLSEVLRHAAEGPTIIHSRGRDLAVLLAIEDYEGLLADHPGGPGTGATFLARIEALKHRHAGGVDKFEPEPMRFRAVDPFARAGRSSKG
ncbi:MAG: type II toxin-antitoxin system Phd/YefM family antitoxin [Byssovorax sp.]